MGYTSENVKASAEEGGSIASQKLLADYSVTPGAGNTLRTPRTPANKDAILQVWPDCLLCILYVYNYCKT